MGSYYSYKLEVVGKPTSKAKLIGKIEADEELSHMLNKWDKHIKNWDPSNKIETLSEDVDDAYLMLTTISECHGEMYQSIYYRGVGMNALCNTLRRKPPMSSVKLVRRRLLKKKKDI